jgi:hypothetical protein
LARVPSAAADRTAPYKLRAIPFQMESSLNSVVWRNLLRAAAAPSRADLRHSPKIWADTIKA